MAPISFPAKLVPLTDLVVSANRGDKTEEMAIALSVAAGLSLMSVTPLACAAGGFAVSKIFSAACHYDEVIAENVDHSEEFNRGLAALGFELGSSLCGLGAAGIMGKAGGMILGNVGQFIGSAIGFHIASAGMRYHDLDSFLREVADPKAIFKSVVYMAIGAVTMNATRSVLNPFLSQPSSQKVISWIVANGAAGTVTYGLDWAAHLTGISYNQHFADLSANHHFGQALANDWADEAALNFRASAIMDAGGLGIHHLSTLKLARSDDQLSAQALLPHAQLLFSGICLLLPPEYHGLVMAGMAYVPGTRGGQRGGNGRRSPQYDEMDRFVSQFHSRNPVDLLGQTQHMRAAQQLMLIGSMKTIEDARPHIPDIDGNLFHRISSVSEIFTSRLEPHMREVERRARVWTEVWHGEKKFLRFGFDDIELMIRYFGLERPEVRSSLPKRLQECDRLIADFEAEAAAFISIPRYFSEIEADLRRPQSFEALARIRERLIGISQILEARGSRFAAINNQMGGLRGGVSRVGTTLDSVTRMEVKNFFNRDPHVNSLSPDEVAWTADRLAMLSAESLDRARNIYGGLSAGRKVLIDIMRTPLRIIDRAEMDLMLDVLDTEGHLFENRDHYMTVLSRAIYDDLAKPNGSKRISGPLFELHVVRRLRNHPDIRIINISRHVDNCDIDLHLGVGSEEFFVEMKYGGGSVITDFHRQRDRLIETARRQRKGLFYLTRSEGRIDGPARKLLSDCSIPLIELEKLLVMSREELRRIAR